MVYIIRLRIEIMAKRVKNRKKKVKKLTITQADIIKANRMGEWAAVNEDEKGWKSVKKVYRNKKKYNRKKYKGE